MRAWRPGLSAGVALRRAFGLPLSFFGGALAHLGVGVTLLGLVGAGFGAETIATLHKGVPAAGRALFGHPRFGRRARRPELQGGGRVDDGALGRRRRRRDRAGAPPIRGARQMTTTQAGLATLNFGQVYVSIADPTPDGARARAPLLEAAGDADLARRRRHGARRRAVARRPAAALRRRRAGEGRRARAGAAGAVTMSWVDALLLVLRSPRRGRLEGRSRDRDLRPLDRPSRRVGFGVAPQDEVVDDKLGALGVLLAPSPAPRSPCSRTK